MLLHWLVDAPGIYVIMCIEVEGLSMDNTAREMILRLLGNGLLLIPVHTSTCNGRNLKDAHIVANRVIGYLDAATALLIAFCNLHNELIDHPDFIELRCFKRKIYS